MDGCHPKAQPAHSFVKLTAAGVEGGLISPLMDKSVYQEAVGSLMYLMICSRPDIAYSVDQVAQFCQNPRKVHFIAVQRILAYLKGTSKHGIAYEATNNSLIQISYSDSDYAGDSETRRSTSGFLFTYNGGPITWGSRRQSCVSVSTMEAEYVAMCESAKDVAWTRQLLSGIGCDQEAPTGLLCDNQGALNHISNPEFHRRTKHIDVQLHYVRDQQIQKPLHLITSGPRITWRTCLLKRWLDRCFRS